jgi:predicted outer membrane repeat protein
VFRFDKQLNKLIGCKVPCRELLYIFLTLFPAPGAAATQGLTDQSSIQVAVHTNASASTSMIDINTVTNWTQLVTACNRTRANITLSPAFKMGVYTNQIDFSDKVIIIFGSNTTLDAGQKGRFFNGDFNKGNTSLELHDTTLKNGTADYGGAIVIADGELQIYDSTFESNTAPSSNGNGGAIFIDQGSLVIHDSTFATNAAYNGAGGAISAENGANLEIHTSSFISNEAGQALGGAIAVDESTVEIYDSTFESNQATYNGGAIKAIGSGAIAEIHDSIFQSNTASTSPGGGLSMHMPKVVQMWRSTPAVSSRTLPTADLMARRASLDILDLVELFMLTMPMSRSTIAPSRATVLPAEAGLFTRTVVVISRSTLHQILRKAPLNKAPSHEGTK